MKIKRVLTIESIDEPTTRRMLKSIYSSETFKEYEIDHCFFLKPHQRSIDNEMLFTLINDKILEFKPDIILIHTGSFFFQNLNVFKSAIAQIRSSFPKLLFGIQGRDLINQDFKKLFNDNKKIRNLEEIFFRIHR